jgi:glutamyl-tRNA synthetase
MTVKTRFAPSPTGMLHIGNVRTALVNWLFTRKLGGEFMLRMDDTDLERSKPEYEEAIKNDLNWLGLKWDSFAKQSERMARYEETKQLLIKNGRLYPCLKLKLS